MRIDVKITFLEEINWFGTLGILSVKHTDRRDVVQWDTHSNLKLSRREVGSGDTFSNRVLDLETRVQLQEIVLVGISIVQILHSSCTLVSNVLGKTLSGKFHLMESFFGHDSGRSLLKDFLETTLGRTITSIKSDGISVLISDNLNFNVTSILTQLHDEDG